MIHVYINSPNIKLSFSFFGYGSKKKLEIFVQGYTVIKHPEAVRASGSGI